jgi:serine/threonine protein kinase
VNTAEGHDGLTEAALRRVGGKINNKWRLDVLLGVGGSAAVYAATHRNGNRVAIKMLHAHLSLDEVIRTRLQQEGYAANLIDHPGAVRILDDDRSEDGSVFLVMELLAGEGLDARLKRKGWRLPRAEALGITFGLLEVLAAAHAKGVIHRDIKPDNVFVTREGQIKVLDFGIARVLDLPPGVNRTRNGALFGTLGFMAPEQALARSHEIDARTDLWAVGATLFTLLSGRLVHEAPTANEQLVNAATRHAPPLATVIPDVDPLLATLVDRALAFRPEDRWQSAPEMQDAVRDVAAAASGPLGIPMLHGPRVSVEVDLEAVDQARGRWASSSFSALQPSIVREPLPPTIILSRPQQRSGGFVMVAVAAVVILAGFLGRQVWSGSRRDPGRPQPVAKDEGTMASPGGALASSNETPSVLLPAHAVPEVAVAGDQVEVVPEADDDASRPQRRVLRHLVRSSASGGTGASGAAGDRSVRDDDALWGRRH